MAKPNITRTFGPIHFEDLDPHRFEDLVRELIYDYKDWQSIEATGRSGSDEGFDVRAYERIGNYYERLNEIESENINDVHPMDGNVWMIQCKREKVIGPTKILDIITDCINKESPPYGYILVAPVNFSKKAYDNFRDELKKMGVMEFYLWGKAELEDMLHMPKFDRILFTFFGISLLTKKSGRSTEIRSFVTTKNKLFKVFDEERDEQKETLFRDINDSNYPKMNSYKDFEQRPRWLTCYFNRHSGLFIWFELKKDCLAYIDIEKKEWDYTFTKEHDEYTNRKFDIEKSKEIQEYNDKVFEFWDTIPNEKKNRVRKIGFVKYSDILVIDEIGDSINKKPHLYVDFKSKNGPFEKIVFIYQDGQNEIILEEEKYKRIKIFNF
jgi:Restriction endonuclease